MSSDNRAHLHCVEVRRHRRSDAWSARSSCAGARPPIRQTARSVRLLTKPNSILPEAFGFRQMRYHSSEKQGMKVPPYIDIIDVPTHLPLRPWVFPVSPAKGPTTDAELEPQTHQSQHPAPHPQSQASVCASAEPSLSNILPTLTLKCARNFETMAMRA